VFSAVFVAVFVASDAFVAGNVCPLLSVSLPPLRALLT
jgi:hypothetical protein